MASGSEIPILDISAVAGGVPGGIGELADQIGAGAHTDYGNITLLVPDAMDQRHLRIYSASGAYS